MEDGTKDDDDDEMKRLEDVVAAAATATPAVLLVLLLLRMIDFIVARSCGEYVVRSEDVPGFEFTFRTSAFSALDANDDLARTATGGQSVRMAEHVIILPQLLSSGEHHIVRLPHPRSGKLCLFESAHRRDEDATDLIVRYARVLAS